MTATQEYWTGKHVVYRCYDAESRLLYVGKSWDLPTRYDYHRTQTPWFGLVARMGLRVYPDHESGLEAEREAIRTERPAFNLRSADMRRRRAKQRTKRIDDEGRARLAASVSARGLTVRELAALCGDDKHRSAIGHLLSGSRSTCNADLADALEAVLTERLFLPDLRLAA